MMKRKHIALLTGLGVLSISSPALAYVGPGAGLALFGALWGVVLAVGAALLFLAAWPLRRWRKRRWAEAAQYDDVHLGGEATVSVSGMREDYARTRWVSPGRE